VVTCHLPHTWVCVVVLPSLLLSSIGGLVGSLQAVINPITAVIAINPNNFIVFFIKNLYSPKGQ